MQSFQRLFQALGQVDSTLSVHLEFSLDDNRRVRVTGWVLSDAKLKCYICLKDQYHSIRTTIDVRIVRTEQEAKEIFDEFDSIVVEDDTITLNELIEDDVLLNIPTQVCAEGLRCENRTAEIHTPHLSVNRPFENIRDLVKLSQ